MTSPRDPSQEDYDYTPNARQPHSRATVPRFGETPQVAEKLKKTDGDLIFIKKAHIHLASILSLLISMSLNVYLLRNFGKNIFPEKKQEIMQKINTSSEQNNNEINTKTANIEQRFIELEQRIKKIEQQTQETPTILESLNKILGSIDKRFDDLSNSSNIGSPIPDKPDKTPQKSGPK